MVRILAASLTRDQTGRGEHLLKDCQQGGVDECNLSGSHAFYSTVLISNGCPDREDGDFDGRYDIEFSQPLNSASFTGSFVFYDPDAFNNESRWPGTGQLDWTSSVWEFSATKCSSVCCNTYRVLSKGYDGVPDGVAALFFTEECRPPYASFCEVQVNGSFR